jgi:hypothetical protein
MTIIFIFVYEADVVRVLLCALMISFSYLFTTTPAPIPTPSRPPRVYYLSMEFLMGRTLLNALTNLDIVDEYK